MTVNFTCQPAKEPWVPRCSAERCLLARLRHFPKEIIILLGRLNKSEPRAILGGLQSKENKQRKRSFHCWSSATHTLRLTLWWFSSSCLDENSYHCLPSQSRLGWSHQVCWAPAQRLTAGLWASMHRCFFANITSPLPLYTS